jgi:diguanylate cyclase (GGDEF)-like protein
VVLESAIREASLEAENARLVAELARVNAALETQVMERTRELKEAVEKLETLAQNDGLTGLYNHRYLQQALSVELSRSKRYGRELGLLFIDVDHFKIYNDLNGHPAGDRVLQRVAQILTGGGQSGLPAQIRASDIVARYGGEEFVLILPETGLSGSTLKAEYVREAVWTHTFEHGQTQPGGRVSISIGVAVFPVHGKEQHELIAAADQELYRAKALGRNRVCVSGQR